MSDENSSVYKVNGKDSRRLTDSSRFGHAAMHRYIEEDMMVGTDLTRLFVVQER